MLFSAPPQLHPAPPPPKKNSNHNYNHNHSNSNGNAHPARPSRSAYLLNALERRHRKQKAPH